MHMNDELLRELTKVKVKLDGISERVDVVSKIIEHDHDVLTEQVQRVKAIEGWIEKHEKLHAQAFDIRFAIFIVVLSTFLSAFFAYVFAHFR